MLHIVFAELISQPLLKKFNSQQLIIGGPGI